MRHARGYVNLSRVSTSSISDTCPTIQLVGNWIKSVAKWNRYSNCVDCACKYLQYPNRFTRRGYAAREAQFGIIVRRHLATMGHVRNYVGSGTDGLDRYGIQNCVQV